MYLLDTNVISAVAPRRDVRHPDLVRWMHDNSDRLFLSAVTIAEIEAGISKARREAAHRKATVLADWLESLLHFYASRVLTLDIAAARATGGLLELARGRGHSPGFADMAIAGIAQVRRLTILTRNLRHFSIVDAAAIDPIAELPHKP